MAIARAAGDRGYCDLLFSRLVRSRGKCQRCGDDYGPFDTAHIVIRGYSATRCELDNAWCLCRTCHTYVDNWPHEKVQFAFDTIGEPRYFELVLAARQGIRVGSRTFWRGERARLIKLCEEAGIDTRWRTAG